MNRFAWKSGAVAIALFSSIPVAGAQELIDAKDPDAIANLFRGYGSARMDKAADDTPAIRGRIEGSAFSVYFYGCDDDDKNCTSLNVTSSWDMDGSVTLEEINAWNAGKRFGRAYIDSNDNAVIETDIDLSGSTTVANLESQIDWWRVVMGDFKSNVIDKAGSGGGSSGGDAAPAAGSNDDTGSGEDGGTASGTPPRGGTFSIPRKPN